MGRQVAAASSVADFLTVVAAVLASAQTRSAGLVVAAFEGAGTVPELCALADELTRQRATTVAWIVDQIAERTPLRRELTREGAIDTVWLLMDPVVFQRLTMARGWTPEH